MKAKGVPIFVRALAITLLIAAMFSHLSPWRSLCPISKVTADIPPAPTPIVIFDIYTQKGGMGSNAAGGEFEPQENITLYAEITSNNCPVTNKIVVFEIVGPMNPYQNISVLLETVTNASGIASRTFRVPLPAEHAAEIVYGPWTVSAQIGIDEKTVGDSLDFEVASVMPEFPAWTMLALVFIWATTIAVLRKWNN